MEQHKDLMRALHRVGVEVVINDPRYCDDSTSGSYFPEVAVLSVCQDYATRWNNRMIGWSSNDLDTLRHEAQHVVQDCNAGELGDGDMGRMFDAEALLEMIKISNIPHEGYQVIWEQYSDTSHTVRMMEMEAFMVASDIPADIIADKVVEYCEVD